ncbi:hypothetical protein GGF31_006807 [Allomyces arbusculus]|nr:hypothetical protein GGF31_006807 [Allomyces arbusculus]
MGDSTTKEAPAPTRYEEFERDLKKTMDFVASFHPRNMTTAKQMWTLVLWISILGSWMTFYHYLLPEPVPATVKNQFSEERARDHIRAITQNVPDRGVGSYGEEWTIRYILNEIESVQANPLRLQPMEVAVSHESGQHFFALAGFPIIKTFDNITNIAVRLPCTECVSDKALIINTHFDAVHGISGAADATLPVAVMLDTLRVMVTDSRPIKNSIVFLWNGAEETYQDGSAAFMENSPWFKDVNTLLNLEAVGVAGKAVLFQTKGQTMLKAYHHASIPHGSSLANDLFQSGLIISDTDYGIFMRSPQVKGGLDMAIYEHSYLYHTAKDEVDRLPAGTIQHMGQNALDIVRYIAYEANLQDAEEDTPDNVTYTDFMGLIFFSAQSHVMLAGYLVLAAIAVLTLVKTNSLRSAAAGIVNQLRMLGMGLLLVLLVAMTVQSSGSVMVWFSEEHFPYLVYGPIALFGLVLGHQMNTRTFGGELMARKSALLLGTIIMVIMAVVGLSSTLIPAVYVMSHLLASLYPPLYYHIAAILPIFIVHPFLIGANNLLVPLTGRMGYDAPTDVIISVVVWLGTVLYFAPMLPLLYRMPLWWQNFVSRFGVGVSMLFFMLLAARSPFTPDTPKRALLLHYYYPQTGVAHLHYIRADPSAYSKDAVEAIASVLGSEPEVDMPLDERFQALQALYPLNEVAHSLHWDTSHLQGKFWVNDDEHLAGAETYAAAYAPRVDGIVVVDHAHNNSRTITIPCAMNAHNAFTVFEIQAEIVDSSAPVVPGRFGSYYVRHVAGGSAHADPEADGLVGKAPYEPRACDFRMTVAGRDPVPIRVVGNSKFMGSRNYYLRRILPLMPNNTAVWAMDAIHVSTVV